MATFINTCPKCNSNTVSEFKKGTNAFWICLIGGFAFLFVWWPALFLAIPAALMCKSDVWYKCDSCKLKWK
ncbi:MAG: hypothetical protein COV45_05135 [Deltaproteobacteria bacterium CG11_big_fil_rev_8_21_14_0_20_47_16]|nr:MAG: hypothetical protein COV45_05135 [Deltaproteobacteria bacterium CG11_big_fil_rev_8_21_14_0_20_47_16]